MLGIGLTARQFTGVHVPDRVVRELRRLSSLWMVLPALALYLTFVVYPVIQSFAISFYDWNGLGPMQHFVGLENYRRILTVPVWADRFWPALGHNLFVFAFGVATLQGGALCFALLLWFRDRRVAGVFRGLYLIPWAVAPAVVATLGQLILHPEYGAFNMALRAIGLGGLERPWLGDPHLALPAVILLGNWQVLGFNVVIYLAALNAIPREIIEQARIDGAGTARLLYRIVLPLLRTTTITLIGLGVIFSFSYFEFVYLVTGPSAGPFYSTDVLATFFYRTTFGGNFGAGASFGMGAAIAVLMLLLVVPSSLAVVKLRSRFDVGY